jgi:hypothetical protein
MGLQRFLDHVVAKKDVWITRRIDTAHRWMSTYPYPE